MKFSTVLLAAFAAVASATSVEVSQFTAGCIRNRCLYTFKANADNVHFNCISRALRKNGTLVVKARPRCHTISSDGSQPPSVPYNLTHDAVRDGNLVNLTLFTVTDDKVEEVGTLNIPIRGGVNTDHWLLVKSWDRYSLDSGKSRKVRSATFEQLNNDLAQQLRGGVYFQSGLGLSYYNMDLTLEDIAKENADEEITAEALLPALKLAWRLFRSTVLMAPLAE